MPEPHFIALAGDERAQFFAELERLAASWAAFKSSRMVDVKWCQPALTVRVKHLAGSKTLRHATVKALASIRSFDPHRSVRHELTLRYLV